MAKPVPHRDLSPTVSGTVPINLPVGLVAEIDRVAAAAEEGREWVILRALRLYLEEEGGDLIEAAEGAAEIDRGEAHDFDEVMDRLRAIADNKGA